MPAPPINQTNLSTGQVIQVQGVDSPANAGAYWNYLGRNPFLTNTKISTTNGNIDLFDITLPPSTICGGHMMYSIYASDGTDFQVHDGAVHFSALNKGGAFTTQVQDTANTFDSTAVSAGSITDTWSIVNGTDKVTIRLNVGNTVITPNSVIVSYCIVNLSSQQLILL